MVTDSELPGGGWIGMSVPHVAKAVPVIDKAIIKKSSYLAISVDCRWVGLELTSFCKSCTLVSLYRYPGHQIKVACASKLHEQCLQRAKE